MLSQQASLSQRVESCLPVLAEVAHWVYCRRINTDQLDCGTGEIPAAGIPLPALFTGVVASMTPSVWREGGAELSGGDVVVSEELVLVMASTQYEMSGCTPVMSSVKRADQERWTMESDTLTLKPATADRRPGTVCTPPSHQVLATSYTYLV